MSKKLSKLASRYARAIFNAIEAEKGAAPLPSGKTPAQESALELAQFVKLWQENHELSQVLLSPMFNQDARYEALKGIVEEFQFSKEVKRLLEVLFERRRLNAVAEISEAFSEKADISAGVLRVLVQTARELPQDEVNKIQHQLSSELSGSPVYTWQVKPEILGGLVIKYGGKVLDGSVSGKLSKLKQGLSG